MQPTKLLQGKVIDQSSDGWGVVKESSGEIYFVPGAWTGDEISFTLQSTGKFKMGKLHSWIHKTAAHRAPPCPHWGLSAPKCSACAWMHIHYSEQLIAKENRLSRTLAQFKLTPLKREPIQSGPEFNYRNRIKLSHENNKIGFKIPMSHEIAEIDSCLVAEDWVNGKIKNVLEAKPPEKEIWIQRGAENTFEQGNTLLNKKMKESIASFCLKEKTNDEIVALELFSGDGNFSEVLLTAGAKVYAYESSPEAIDSLSSRFPQITARSLDLYSTKSLKILKEHKDSNLLLLDPPRSGYKDLRLLCEKLPKLKKILYVSCNPATFARDVSQLKNWSLKRLQSFDLFPQTPHIEVIGVLERNA
ncbi:MAG: hypothetical protein R3A80_06535 [Bdellovibrionota bacterium]